MQDSALLVLPLPILTALLGAAIAVLILRLDLGSKSATVLFALLFALLSFSSLLVGLRFGYGLEQVTLIQRTLPMLVGPLLYLGFAAFAVPKGTVCARHFTEPRRSVYCNCCDHFVAQTDLCARLGDHPQLRFLLGCALAVVAERARLLDTCLFRCGAKSVQLDAARHGLAVYDITD